MLSERLGRCGRKEHPPLRKRVGGCISGEAACPLALSRRSRRRSAGPLGPKDPPAALEARRPRSPDARRFLHRLQENDGPRLLHLRNRFQPGAQAANHSGSATWLCSRRSWSWGRGGIGANMATTTYAAIVVGSGITGRLARNELPETRLNTLVLEAGRSIVPERDYVEHVPVWERKDPG